MLKTERLPDRLALERKLVHALRHTSKCLESVAQSFVILSNVLHEVASTEPVDHRPACLKGAANVRQFEEALSEMVVGIDAGKLAFTQIPKCVAKRAMGGFKTALKMKTGTTLEQANAVISAYSDFEGEHIQAMSACFEGLARLAKSMGMTSLSSEYIYIASSFKPERARAITTNRYRDLLRTEHRVNAVQTIMQSKPVRANINFDESIIVNTEGCIFDQRDHGHAQKLCLSVASKRNVNMDYKPRVFQLPAHDVEKDKKDLEY